jgi:DnaJ-class molecular chaperone
MTSTPAPTYYEILNLSQATLSTQDEATAAALVKRAYRRALLNHHPDKTKHQHKQQQQRNINASTPLFTVDQISAAYATLSRAAQRKAYDRTLQIQRAQAQQQQGSASSAGGATPSDFQTGIENVDLDDLASDDGGEGLNGGMTAWYRSCRCGNPRGYHFTEADLEDAADLGELMVGCADCSLWLRVHFAVVDDDDGDKGRG